MANDEIIKNLEKENLRIIAENKKLKEFIRNIKRLLEWVDFICYIYEGKFRRRLIIISHFTDGTQVIVNNT